MESNKRLNSGYGTHGNDVKPRNNSSCSATESSLSPSVGFYHDLVGGKKERDTSGVRSNYDNDLAMQEEKFRTIFEPLLRHYQVKESRINEIFARYMVTGEDLPIIARDIGVLSDEQAVRISAELAGLPYLGEDIEPSLTILEMVEHGYIDLSKNDGYVPIDFTEGTFQIAIASSNDIQRVTTRFLLPCEFGVASASEIQRIYRQYFARAKDVFNDYFVKAMTEFRSRSSLTSGVMSRRLLMAIIRYAAYMGCSDIQLHKTVERVGLIRTRYNGVLDTLGWLPESLYDQILSVIVNDSNLAEKIKQEHLPGKIKFNDDDLTVLGADFPTSYGLRVHVGNAGSRGYTSFIRILPRNNKAVSLSHIGYSAPMVQELERIAKLSVGLFLVTGPTGSGKSTTLYSMLSLIDSIEKSVQTVENPIEFHHGAWIQYEPLGNNTEKEAANKGVVSMLRSDPDVILVGEIRDSGVSDATLKGANTGHMVFSTLHTNSAAAAIPRLLGLGVDPQDLALALRGVLAQRLVRKLCHHCKKQSTDVAVLNYLKEELGQSFNDPINLYDACGCPICSHTGYMGRQVIYEMIVVDDVIKEMIESGEHLSKIERYALYEKKGAEGSLKQNGLRLVAKGITTLSELERVES